MYLCIKIKLNANDIIKNKDNNNHGINFEKISLFGKLFENIIKTIITVIKTIKSKDFIILDEPTDGFSSEQLDKIREVLEQLDMDQVIIVSHESKIESFVDHVIRISKTEHKSQIHD